jgi:hypothetical protein
MAFALIGSVAGPGALSTVSTPKVASAAGSTSPFAGVDLGAALQNRVAEGGSSTGAPPLVGPSGPGPAFQNYTGTPPPQNGVNPRLQQIVAALLSQRRQRMA